MATYQERISKEIKQADHWQNVAATADGPIADTARRMARNGYAYALLLDRKNHRGVSGFFRRVRLVKTISSLTKEGGNPWDLSFERATDPILEERKIPKKKMERPVTMLFAPAEMANVKDSLPPRLRLEFPDFHRA